MADVIVLGAGCAGMRAALEARNAGCDVLVVEKAETFGGTSIRSGGIIQAAGTETQRKAGIADDSDRFAELLMLQGEGWVDKTLIDDMCTHSAEHLSFLEGLGLQFTELSCMAHIPFDGGLIVPRTHGTQSGAEGIFTALHDAAERAGVRFRYRCEARHLVTDGHGIPRGVEAVDLKDDDRIGENTVLLGARRGIIIATGGVDQNPGMLARLNHQQHWDLMNFESFSAPGNTGDGVRMGVEVGGALRNFGGTIDLSGRLLAGINAETPMMAAIFVNRFGRRFVCEDCTYAYTARSLYEETMRTHHSCYTVFGARSLPYGSFTLQSVKSEVDAGTAWTGDTIEELARAIEVDPANLAGTIGLWNRDVSKGCDSLLGRITGLRKIEPPFFAFIEGVMNLGGIGGLSIDSRARVLDLEGHAIPHLYAAGMASAGWIGPYYPASGTALLGGLHWGWRAGTDIAASTDDAAVTDGAATDDAASTDDAAADDDPASPTNL